MICNGYTAGRTAASQGFAIFAQKHLQKTEVTNEVKGKSADSKLPLSDRQKQILSVLDKGKEYSAEEVAALIGLKGPRTRQLLNELVDMKLLNKTAVTRGRKLI